VVSATDVETRVVHQDKDGHKMTAICTWTVDAIDGGHDTACGSKHDFTDGGIAENSYVYCPFCGGTIVDDLAVKLDELDSHAPAQDEAW